MRSRILVASFTMGLTVVVTGPGFALEEKGQAPSRVVEIRSYNLKPGTRDRFHRLFEREALPLLQRAKVDVVSYGPSLHDGDSYYLMRSFSSVEDRQRSEDAFYGSAEWRQGPREAILACIESYTTVVIRLDDATIRGLRGMALLPPSRNPD
jgi:NIPSNAP